MNKLRPSMSDKTPVPFQEQAQQHVEEEAARIARSIQVPGQTKEQTKWIAKGIEKGIALYKQQQKAKARERDKARKKLLRQTSEASEPNAELQSEDGGAVRTSVKSALMLSGVLCSVVAIGHGIRYALQWPLIMGTFSIPLWWSLPVAVLAAALAVWMFTLSLA